MFRIVRSFAMLMLATTLSVTAFAVDDQRQWVIEAVTQPEDGSFSSPQIGQRGSLWYSNFIQEAEFTRNIGIYQNGSSLSRYEGVRIWRMDIIGGRLWVAVENNLPYDHYSIQVGGVEVYQSKLRDLALPVFDRNGRDFIWAQFPDDRNIKPSIMFSNGSAPVSVLDLLPAQGHWLPSDHWFYQPIPIGYSGGKVYFEVTEYLIDYDPEVKVQVHTDVVDGSTKQDMTFGPIIEIDRVVMNGDFILVYGDDSSGAKKMFRRNVRTGRSKIVPFPEGLDSANLKPVDLKVNASGAILFSQSDGEKGGDLKVYLGNGYSWTNPLVVGYPMYSTYGRMPQEWSGNQIVWQGNSPGETNSQIFRAKYQRVR